LNNDEKRFVHWLLTASGSENFFLSSSWNSEKPGLFNYIQYFILMVIGNGWKYNDDKRELIHWAHGKANCNNCRSKL